MATSVLLQLLEPLALMVVLAMARSAGLLLALPATSGKAVPKMVRVIVVLAISLALVGISGPPQLRSAHPLAIGVAILGELVLGLALGFVVHMVLAGIRMAGEIIGVEIGLSFSAVADPMGQGTSTATSSLVGHLGIQLLLVLGIDRELIRGLAVTVGRIPLGEARFRGPVVVTLASQMGDVFVSALRLALPVMASIFAMKLALAVLARFVPRLQIFALAFAISLVVGLNALQQALPGLATAISAQLEHSVRQFYEVLETFTNAPAAT